MASYNFDRGFDYDKAKKRYMDLLQAELAKDGNYLELSMHSSDNINKLINEIKLKKQNKESDADYDVIKKDTVEILVKKRPISEVGARILSFDDVFNIYMKMHFRCAHASKEWLLEQADINRYVCPKICMELLIQVCDLCNKARSSKIIEQLLSKSKARKSVVYVISVMQKRIDQKCHYILIYLDKATNFVLLRPMMEKTEKEISLTLFQIFTQFGAPEQLCLHGYDPELARKIDNFLKKLCPMFNIVVEHRRMSFYLPTTITDKLDEWRNKAKSDIWEVGCSIVQKELNDKFDRNPIKDAIYAKPFSLYFTERTYNNNY